MSRFARALSRSSAGKNSKSMSSRRRFPCLASTTDISKIYKQRRSSNRRVRSLLRWPIIWECRKTSFLRCFIAPKLQEKLRQK